MADVPDHLVPTDGLTDSFVRYAGLDASEGGAAIHRFTLEDNDGGYLATFEIETGPSANGTVDGMIVDAHRRMVDVLRQWLFVTEASRKAYER